MKKSLVLFLLLVGFSSQAQLMVKLSKDTAICEGGYASITTSITGGTPPYTLSWNVYPGWPNNQVYVVRPTVTTTYILHVTDSVLATSRDTIVINVNKIPLIKANSDSVCQGGCAILTASGGTSYSWMAWPIKTGNPQTFCPNYTTSYTVIGIDQNGCTNDTKATIFLRQSFGINNSSNLCKGGDSISLSIVETTGTLNNTYSWSPAIGLSSTTGKSVKTMISTTTEYTVFATNPYNCSYSNTTIVIANEKPKINISPSNTLICKGTCLSLTATGDSGNSYTWNIGSTGSTLNICPNTTQNYSVSCYNFFTGCYNTATATVSVNPDCGIIKGIVHVDTNFNCIKDVFEKSVSKGIVTAKNGNQQYYGSLKSNGNYVIYCDTGIYLVTCAPNQKYMNSACPLINSYTVSIFNPKDSSINNNFAYNELSAQDLSISLSATASRPGSNFNYLLYYCNNGTKITSGTVKLSYDSILTYLKSTPPPFDSVYPNLTWSYVNLLPGECRFININLYVPTMQNGGYLGRILKAKAIIEPIATDTIPNDNIFSLKHEIRAAYDPNMKIVSPPGKDTPGYITLDDSLLHYTIHFQNTGTDTAFKIVVKDTLSYSYLDVASVKTGASSHPYNFEVSGKGILTWTFNNILLPDSNTNEPGSHGFVSFTIKQKKNNPKGTSIKNKAEIYFDTNPPVVTNTIINTITDFVGISEPGYREVFVKTYPNPFNDYITFEITGIEANSFSLIVYDALGREVKMLNKITTPVFTLKRDNLESGIYFFEIRSDGQPFSRGKLVIK